MFKFYFCLIDFILSGYFFQIFEVFVFFYCRKSLSIYVFYIIDGIIFFFFLNKFKQRIFVINFIDILGDILKIKVMN